MKPLAVLSLSVAFCLTAGAAVITPVATRAALGANDTLQWGLPSADLTSVTVPYNRTSVGGVSAVASTLATELGIFVQNGPNSGLGANFLDGDVLLSTVYFDGLGNEVNGNGPITIAFGTPVSGVGFQLTHFSFGNFTGTLNFFNGATLMGTVTGNGVSNAAADNSALFLGGTSDLLDITSVSISVSSLLGNTGFHLNYVSLLTTAPNAVPEPSTFGMLSGAIALGLWIRRRRV